MILVISPNVEILSTTLAALASTGEEVKGAGTTHDALALVAGARMIVLDLLTSGPDQIDGDAFRGLSNVTIISRHLGRPILIGPDRYSKGFTLARLKEALQPAPPELGTVLEATGAAA